MRTDRVIPNELKDKIRILVVEDNLLSRKLTTFLLKNWGYRYDECSNGKLALENMQLHKYDLILMDVHMPELDGYQTTRFIRSEMELGLPIIAMTACADAGERERCLMAGMNDYLTKPLQEEELYNVIANYLYVTVVLNQENKPKKKSNLPIKRSSSALYVKK